MSPFRNARPTIGLVLISAGALAFEISLTRLFAVQQFHHFAFVVVSLAVMGIAASGLLLAVRPKHPPLAHLSSGFAASAALAYVTINLLPFDSYSIAWDRQQVWILVLYFLISGAPFLFAGWTVGACLAEAGPEAHRPYAANLVGSALGCPVALLTLSLFGGEGAVALSITLGLLAAFTLTPRRNPRLILAVLSGLTLWAGIRPPAVLSLHLSPYKPLSITSLAPDAKNALTLWSASARLDVVESDSVHVLPGLSLNANIQFPRQAAMFIDGDGPIPINTLSPDDPNAQAIATHMPASLAYNLRPNARSLILMPGAGLDAVIALAAGASNVTLAIDEPLIRYTLTGPYADFSHNLLHDSRLDISERLGRGALRASGEDYDVIQFALSDPYRPVTSGAFSLTENYTLTIEAFTEAYQRLTDDGLLVITRWLGTPPSESARTWATLLAALKNQEIANPAPCLIAYRSMRTATMIVARKPFSPTELETTRSFLETNGFDPIFLPDLDPAELNRFLRLPQDTYHEIFTALLADPLATIAAYDFNLSPPTDNRPFFFHFFRWRQTPAVIATLGQTWQPFGGSGYLVLLALLGLMLMLALPLALAPVLVFGRKSSRSSARAPALIYFACLGAGYLLVEIPLIQRLTLLLNRPAQALAAVLFTLLLFSGIGSLLSARLDLRKAMAALLLLLALTTATLPTAIRVALPWQLGARLVFAILLLAPTGLLMGIPFAAGLRFLETRSPGSIPWAWAINGAISGVSGVLAAIVSLDWGYTLTMTLGAIAYAIGLATVFRLGWAPSSKEKN